MIQHPLPIKTKVVFESKGCNCANVKSKPANGVIARAMDFNGSFWYGMDNGMQIHSSKVLKVLE